MAYDSRGRQHEPSWMRWSYVLAVIGVIILLGYGVTTVSNGPTGGTGKAAVIPITGTISFGGDRFSQSTTPAQVERVTRQAEHNDKYKAVIYEINSGGGAAVASKRVSHTIKNVGKPTVCLMEESAASGALWAATACDTVVADSLSMTGSIGVTSSYLEFSGLLDRFNVTYVNLSTGEFKGMGSPYQDISEKEKKRFMDTLQQVHDEFVQAVAENRGLSTEDVRAVADGQILLGQEAKNQGLVDRLGGKDEALKAAEEHTGAQLELERLEERKPFNVLKQLSAQIGYGFSQGLQKISGQQPTTQTDAAFP